MKRPVGLALVLFAVVVSARLLSGQQPPLRPGDALAGISAADFELFRLGQADFTEVESTDEGLGPAFNGTSCAACHSNPAIGGIGGVAELRAGRRHDDGRFSPLDASGNTLFHIFSIPNHACQPILPPDANVIVRRVPIPLFGAGLIEAIPDETLLGLEDPTDRNRDGVSGRAAIITDIGTGQRRVGRFGWKAQHATLLAFGSDAYRNEMGITNQLFPTEVAHGVSSDSMRVCDPIPEPEDIPDPLTGRRGIDNFESFMKLLAPLGRTAISAEAREGDRVFAAIGCSACHVPVLTTGSNANPLFNRQTVPLFSDLLLHEVGTGDGIAQEAAEPNEIRTPALWGLRFRRPLLHDGSAATIEDAISRHAGEAALARDGFDKLNPTDRAALLAFLKSL